MSKSKPTVRHYCKATMTMFDMITKTIKPTIFVAFCGYESTDAKQFVQPPQQPDPAKVTCTECRNYDKNKESE